MLDSELQARIVAELEDKFDKWRKYAYRMNTWEGRRDIVKDQAAMAAKRYESMEEQSIKHAQMILNFKAAHPNEFDLWAQVEVKLERYMQARREFEAGEAHWYDETIKHYKIVGFVYQSMTPEQIEMHRQFQRNRLGGMLSWFEYRRYYFNEFQNCFKYEDVRGSNG